ncbi:hypothetical protein [Streptomyces sp. VRA16 Mangrove soil]|uniref:hypothetical protein n=1 Tax=Streptomyces sp. VRA16 Mangrove soil TaxID=2817434 RepID=UPI001A9CFB53|nr:hypothetical protein [Streptomyces sp. VRA16 Mangrove soil]MBO1331177.1 hypothetical protein [Streptomyces sp. VRA16 Mangrove soil]
MRSLPLPVTLTVRLLPVAVLACVGWAWSTGPMSEPAAKDKGDAAPQSSAPQSPSASVASKTYPKPPEPCGTVTAKTVKALVPDAKTAGKELSATDESVRRGCSWSALKGYDYRWLDVSFEVKNSDALAKQSYKDGGADDSKASPLAGLGDEARVTSSLTTKDKQDTRESVVTVRKANVLVTVTYNGSDFESKGAPSNDTVIKGARQAAGDAVAALGSAD